MDYTNLDALGLAELVKKGEVSPAELVEEAIGRIERLNPEAYQVRIEHGGYARLDVTGVVVQTGQVLEMGRLEMPPGALIDGTVQVDGRPAGQVRVTATRKPSAGVGALKVEAVSDARGRFRLPLPAARPARIRRAYRARLALRHRR